MIEQVDEQQDDEQRDGEQFEGVWLGRRVTARTPASSANLGPGFDSLALAFALYDEVSVEAFHPAGRPGSVDVQVSGEGHGSVPLGEDHLVVSSLRAGLAHAGAGRPSLRLVCRNAIPHGRGLGSSAAAIVVGLILAQGLLTDPSRLDDDAVFALATAAEGHPDNAAAAQFGGFVVAWTDPQLPGDGDSSATGAARPAVVRPGLDPRIQAVVCIPDEELATAAARAMLPSTVPHQDAAFTAGRAALLVHALTARPDLLMAATQERLHQAQRAPAMPRSAALIEAVRAAGGAAVVSGAGPTVVVLGVGDGPATAVGVALATAATELGSWRVLPVSIDTMGTVLITESGVDQSVDGVR